MSKMFPFITDTWNPLGGICPHNCRGCWAKKIIKEKKMVKYQGPYKIDEKQINKKFKSGSFVFVCDMLDLFAANVPMVAIQMILNRIATQPNVTFLLLTKNPRYMWLMDLPKNVVAGATIESEIDPHLCGDNYSNAPLMHERIKAMIELDHPRKFISIEPIMDFSPGGFIDNILAIKPECIAIGFDNYDSKLPEPESLEKVLEFINCLEKEGIKVYRKSIREPYPQEVWDNFLREHRQSNESRLTQDTEISLRDRERLSHITASPLPLGKDTKVARVRDNSALNKTNKSVKP